MTTELKASLRRSLVIGNWKMHKTVSESVAAVRRLGRLLKSVRGPEVVVAPSFIALKAVGEALKGTGLRLAAQDVHWEKEGGYTGEVSPVQLKDVGCRYALVGHSERRRILGETDEMVRQKLAGALKHGLCPVLCVGETLEQRRAGQTADVVGAQLEKALAGVAPDEAGRIVIAYEPVWAIGTGQVATAAQISEARDLIRDRLVARFGLQTAGSIRILYGGSVTPENIDELAAIKRLDGVLVGGASLRVDAFAAIVRAMAKIKREG